MRNFEVYRYCLCKGRFFELYLFLIGLENLKFANDNIGEKILISNSFFV